MALKTKKIILSILLIMVALGLIGLYSYYSVEYDVSKNYPTTISRMLVVLIHWMN